MENVIKPISKRTQRDYSITFKLEVVGQVEKGELTYKQAQYQYAIQGRSTVLVWLCKHGRLNWSKYTPNTLYKGAAMTQLSEQQTLEQRIKTLEKELEEMQLKAGFLEAVVKDMDRDGVCLSKKRKAELLRKKRLKNSL